MADLKLSDWPSCVLVPLLLLAGAPASASFEYRVPIRGLRPVAVAVKPDVPRDIADLASLSVVIFNMANVGGHVDGTATLTNIGDEALSLSPISATSVTGVGYDFLGTSCGSTLEVDESCSVTVRHTPETPGLHAGTLTVTTGSGELVVP